MPSRILSTSTGRNVSSALGISGRSTWRTGTAGDDMGKISPMVQPLAIFTGYISILQAVSWATIDILAIIGWAECEPWDPKSVFLNSLQEIYYKDHSICDLNITKYDWYSYIMNPYDVLAWMIIMLVFNSIWFFASVALIAGWDHKLLRHAKWVTITWCLITSAVCIVDLIACAMFGADYGTIYKMHPTTDPTYLAPPAMIMTLAIRGFTLWFFNAGMVVYFLAHMPSISRQNANIRQARKDETTPMDLYGPPAPGYDAYNQGFTPDNHHQPGHQQHTQRSSRATDQLTAGYPRTAPGQHIPRPDYSPPSDVRHSRYSTQEPQLRSALKNKY